MTDFITKWMLKAQKALSGRKPMAPAKKKRKKGPAGESVDYKLNPDSAMGKAQQRNRTQADQLQQLDRDEKEAAARRRSQ